MPNATIRVSGLLCHRDTAPWIFHQEDLTEAQAIDVIIAHMQFDALSIPMLNDVTPAMGPVHAIDGTQDFMAWGNFTVASAGFEIRPISLEGAKRLQDAFAAHRQTRHFQIAEELESVASAKYAEMADVRMKLRQSDQEYVRRTTISKIDETYAPTFRAARTELDAIFNAGWDQKQCQGPK